MDETREGEVKLSQFLCLNLQSLSLEDHTASVHSGDTK